ncbi:hypothetical protein HELRODRAFT_78998, partial [Helobdella robusta]|uniref:Selenoprotein M n=1 Tax=Helobdella robusta TaxID=6412 RepID=T1G3I0_HELRO
RLNRYPEVKRFIFDDIPLFHNVEFKSVPGASPNLYFLNAQDEKVETVDLTQLDREGCNQLLIRKGFFKRNNPGDGVPPQFKDGPYGEHVEL